MRTLIGVVVVAAAMLVVGAPRASASGADPFNVISFSGSGERGKIAPGFSWRLLFGGTVLSIPFPTSPWPAPPTPGEITDFTATFTGATISTSIFTTDTPTFTVWTSALSNHDHTVTFTAPPGVSLNSGGEFASTFHFTNPVDSVNFKGAWSAVPEPRSLLLFGSGLLLLGTIGRKLLHG